MLQKPSGVYLWSRRWLLIFSKHTHIKPPLTPYNSHTCIHTYSTHLYSYAATATQSPTWIQHHREQIHLRIVQSNQQTSKPNAWLFWRQLASSMQSTVRHAAMQCLLVCFSEAYYSCSSSVVTSKTVALVCATWAERQERVGRDPWQRGSWLGAQPWV